MKRLNLAFFLIVCLFCVPCYARNIFKSPLGRKPNWNNVLSRNLTFHLPFNEGTGSRVHDSTLTGVYGDLQNMVPLDDWIVTEFGMGLDFGHATERIEVAHNAYHIGSEITILAWIYPRTSSGLYDNVVLKGTSPYAYQMYFINNLIFYSDSDSGTSSGTIPKNQWDQFGIVANGLISGGFYMNGAIQENEALTPNTSATGVMRISTWAASNRPLDGILRKYSFYRRALSRREIKQLHDFEGIIFKKPIIMKAAVTPAARRVLKFD